MCKNCFEHSEKSSDIMEDNQRLLDENIRLRKQLHDANESLKQIITLVKITKEGLSKICGENSKDDKNHSRQTFR